MASLTLRMPHREAVTVPYDRHETLPNFGDVGLGPRRTLVNHQTQYRDTSKSPPLGAPTPLAVSLLQRAAARRRAVDNSTHQCGVSVVSLDCRPINLEP